MPSVCIHAERRGVDHHAEAGGVVAPDIDLQLRVLRTQPLCQCRCTHRRDVVKRQARSAGRRERRGDREARAPAVVSGESIARIGEKIHRPAPPASE